MTDLNSETSSEDLFRLISNSLATSISNARGVSSEDENGDPARQTLDELALSSGVGRSTIAKYVSSTNTKDDGKSVVNPDLRTICQLAHCFNVPPALLLMRPDDWARLAQAVIDYVSEIDDKGVQSVTDQVISAVRASSIEKSKSVVKLAERCGKYRPVDKFKKALMDVGGNTALAEQISSRNKRLKKGIVTTAALPQLQHLSPQAIAAVLTLCVKLGATH